MDSTTTYMPMLQDALGMFLFLGIELSVLFLLISAGVSLLQQYIPDEKIQSILSASGGRGYVLAALLGAITPFCTCSTIPMLRGLLRARAGFGPTITFLFTSPLLNPIIVGIFFVTFGFTVTIIYTIVALMVSLLAGMILQSMGFERYIIAETAQNTATCCATPKAAHEAPPSCCTAPVAAQTLDATMQHTLKPFPAAQQELQPFGQYAPQANTQSCCDTPPNASLSEAPTETSAATSCCPESTAPSSCCGTQPTVSPSSSCCQEGTAPTASSCCGTQSAASSCSCPTSPTSSPSQANNASCCAAPQAPANAPFSAKLSYAFKDAWGQFKHVLPYLVIGVSLGAFVYGFVPSEFIAKYASGDSVFAVPIAAVIGIPLYVRVEALIPLSAVLVQKGMGLGAVMALIVGGGGASLTEVILLKSLFRMPMIVAFLGVILGMAVLTGYIFQYLI